MKVEILAIILGTVVACVLLGMGWQSDMALLPQVMLIVGGWIARSVVLFAKGE